MASVSVDYLIPSLRNSVGDVEETNQRYVDEWLRVSLLSSIKALQRWWGNKYLVDDVALTVERNEEYTSFAFVEPPVIQHRDELAVILMASILIKTGQLEKNSWNVGSWRDAEIAVSNIEGNKAKEFGVKGDLASLYAILKPPQKRLFSGVRTSFPES